MLFDYAAIRSILLDLMRSRRSSVPVVASQTGMSETTLRNRLRRPEDFRVGEIDVVARALGTTFEKVLSAAAREARL